MTSKSQKHPEDESEDLGDLEKEETQVPPAEVPAPEAEPKAPPTGTVSRGPNHA